MLVPTHEGFWRIENMVQKIARARLSEASHCKLDERDIVLVGDNTMDVPQPSMSLLMLVHHSRHETSHCCHDKEADRPPGASSAT